MSSAVNSVVQLQRAARAVSLESARWPFPWSTPGPNAIWFSARGVLALPAPPSGYVPVAAFEVPDGYEACISQLLIAFEGAGFVQGSGSLLWRLDVNAPAAGSITGRVVPGYDAINTTLGSLSAGPWPLAPAIGLRFSPGDLIQLKVNSALAGPAVGEPVVCMFEGWRWPVDRGGF